MGEPEDMSASWRCGSRFGASGQGFLVAGPGTCRRHGKPGLAGALRQRD